MSAAHIVADASDQQLDIANAPYLGERRTIERQLEWADINTVTLDQADSTIDAALERARSDPLETPARSRPAYPDRTCRSVGCLREAALMLSSDPSLTHHAAMGL